MQSTRDGVLHVVSISAYETHRWKEDSCSPDPDGDLAQGANKNLNARPQPCVTCVFLCKVGPWPFRGNSFGIRLTITETPDRSSTKGALILIAIWLQDFWVVSPAVGIVSAEGFHD